MEHSYDCNGMEICIKCTPNHCPKPDPIPHKCCEEPEFAEVYSIQSQDLTASPGLNLEGQVVKFEKTVYATANIDISQAGTNGKITINKAGWYDVATGVCGLLNPISAPLPVWSVAVFVNGILIPGSPFANMTLSPVQQANEIVADVFVHFNKGDILEVANTSTSLVTLSAPTLGTNAQVNSAFLKIILLKAD